MIIASARRKRPDELRMGCAVKSISGEMKILAQIKAVRRKIPACARTAVPGELSARKVAFALSAGASTDDEIVV